MKISRSIIAVDSHTMGEPTRVIIGGIPNIPGKTMSEKKEYMASNLDYLRTALLLEPRGHSDMFGAIMTSPTIPDADFGVIFMESGGYVNMCGHGTIGVCTVAVEMGMVTPIEPITNITLDTPAGIVKAGVAVSNGRTKGVTFENVPAFLYKKDVSINTPTFGEIKMDIAFGGNFFALISAERLGLKIEKPYAQRLIDAGMEILECVNNSIQVGHPEKPHINTIDLVEIFEKVPQEGVHYRNAVIFGEKSLDRSPCGTGTCAKMASLFARGELKIGQEFINESILGTQFIGRLKGTTKVAGLDAVIPEITGRAFVTGVSHYMIDDEDPLKYGFTLR